MTEWLTCAAITAVGCSTWFWLGRWYERRRWTRTVRHHLPGSATVMIDEAGMTPEPTMARYRLDPGGQALNPLDTTETRRT